MPRLAKATPDETPDVFIAIAHPVRRALLDRLVAGDQPVNRLAEHFAMSRPAISQHLRVLREAGLVAERRSGRERRYRLQPERLGEVRDWLRRYEGFWGAKLDALDDFLAREP
jgi:DNA-binding transcriptional ArsR family regulator